ncbi:putative lysyl-tRNA synthetase [Aspergillus stella-maris]|uniref:putative lysyl-tRNA synthetase n=1 Tax=Aspergillus stella-maris TaxID=1810926 RepID=UPI003CCCDC3D
MQSIRPRWAAQLKGRYSPLSTGSLIATTAKTQHCRVAYRDPVLGRWKSTESPKNTSVNGFEGREQELKNLCPTQYPRHRTTPTQISSYNFHNKYKDLQPKECVDNEPITFNGRVRSVRLAGSKLFFLDMLEDGHGTQVMFDITKLEGVDRDTFKKWSRLIRRGDSLSITGNPYSTPRGTLTVRATKLPTLLSPCRHDLPLDAHEHENSPYPRHVQFLADQSSKEIIQARTAIIQEVRQFLLGQNFMEIDTPILNSIAGGASARPFATSATEFPDRPLSLRIAPELWLKRLIVGGFDRVFEIGPSFRNEGLDKTHNPEFTTCEFYRTYQDLEDLIATTEQLLSGISQRINELNEKIFNGKLTPTTAEFTVPFDRIDFIGGIEAGIGRPLPDLEAPDALSKVADIFNNLSQPLPENPTLPRLLDELCSIYVEPQCQNPTFIINPPECLSPLSKSFVHPENNQRVAARAELFIEGKEVVNTYEEENSPFEQRRKFEDQLRYSRDAKEPGEMDEEYLQALEWGLPPTGGWGCGIDRLVMLFTGKKRIADVLPFGNLRTVTRRSE